MVEYNNNNNNIILLNNYLSSESIIELNKKYSIELSLLSQQIKKILLTDNLFSILTINGNLFSFGNLLFRTNKIIDIYSNKLFFCGIKQNNDILIWGENFDKYILKLCNKQGIKNYSIKTFDNGFSILSSNNLYLIKDKSECIIIKNITKVETFGELNFFKTEDKIIYFKNDVNDVKEFSLLEDSSKKNKMKNIFINKLMNDKSRLLYIIKKTIQ